MFLERLQTSKTTTWWRLQNTTCCQKSGKIVRGGGGPGGSVQRRCASWQWVQSSNFGASWLVSRSSYRALVKTVSWYHLLVYTVLRRARGDSSRHELWSNNLPRTFGKIDLEDPLLSLYLVLCGETATGPAPRNSEFLTFCSRFCRFSWRDFKPQKTLLVGGFKIQLVVKI